MRRAAPATAAARRLARAWTRAPRAGGRDKCAAQPRTTLARSRARLAPSRRRLAKLKVQLITPGYPVLRAVYPTGLLPRDGPVAGADPVTAAPHDHAAADMRVRCAMASRGAVHLAATWQVRAQQGQFMFAQDCPRCRGAGKVIQTPCKTCRGDGACPPRPQRPGASAMEPTAGFGLDWARLGPPTGFPGI